MRCEILLADALAAAALSGQDLTGAWQGILRTGSQEARHTQDWGLGLADEYATSGIPAGGHKQASPFPILAIFAIPHAAPSAIRNDAAALAAYEAREEAAAGARRTPCFSVE